MSFDAFTLRAAATELDRATAEGRVEKVLQPSKDEICLVIHKDGKHPRLQINAGAASPRIGITSETPENPKVPPAFCMLVRKHLTGAKVSRVFQHGFERVLEIEFETYDEMGFPTKRRLIAEIMGRYSNAVLCDGDLRIISALRPVDFTTSRKRQILPGMLYEMPPEQDGKTDPLTESEEGFLEKIQEPTDKEIMTVYSGFSPLLARETVFRAQRPLTRESLCRSFFGIVDAAKRGDFSPTLVLKENGEPFEFSAFDIKQYSGTLTAVSCATLGEATDGFFAERERRDREKQRSYATGKLLKNIESRLVRKLEAQRKELKDTEKRSVYKEQADALTANMYLLGDAKGKVTLIAYVEDGEGGYAEKEVVVDIERGLTAARYAQKLYKKYTKARNAERELGIQIVKGERELEYIRSVQDELTRINGQKELDEINEELADSGYIKRKETEVRGKKGQVKKKSSPGSPITVRTSGGFTVCIGKNNLQNDALTFRTASKNDIWFHVKDMPGSHTVLFTDGREPSDDDLTEAATLAALNSKAAGSDRVNVDYTRIKNVKKPSGARPGFVIYENYKTATVSAEPLRAENTREENARTEGLRPESFPRGDE